LEQHRKHVRKKVLKLTTHNEYLFKEKHQSRVKFFELKRKNNQLDVNMRQRESTRLEIEHKLAKTTERLRVTKEKNLELHNVISKIDH
jgi:hypothetical protein